MKVCELCYWLFSRTMTPLVVVVVFVYFGLDTGAPSASASVAAASDWGRYHD